MRNIRVFHLNFFQFWEVKFSIYLNRRVFVMLRNSMLMTGQTNKVPRGLDPLISLMSCITFPEGANSFFQEYPLF